MSDLRGALFCLSPVLMERLINAFGGVEMVA
jgi:hypothetical protein